MRCSRREATHSLPCRPLSEQLLTKRLARPNLSHPLAPTSLHEPEHRPLPTLDRKLARKLDRDHTPRPAIELHPQAQETTHRQIILRLEQPGGRHLIERHEPLRRRRRNGLRRLGLRFASPFTFLALNRLPQAMNFRDALGPSAPQRQRARHQRRDQSTRSPRPLPSIKQRFRTGTSHSRIELRLRRHVTQPLLDHRLIEPPTSILVITGSRTDRLDTSIVKLRQQSTQISPRIDNQLSTRELLQPFLCALHNPRRTAIMLNHHHMIQAILAHPSRRKGRPCLPGINIESERVRTSDLARRISESVPRLSRYNPTSITTRITPVPDPQTLHRKRSRVQGHTLIRDVLRRDTNTQPGIQI